MIIPKAYRVCKICKQVRFDNERLDADRDSHINCMIHEIDRQLKLLKEQRSKL